MYINRWRLGVERHLLIRKQEDDGEAKGMRREKGEGGVVKGREGRGGESF